MADFLLDFLLILTFNNSKCFEWILRGLDSIYLRQDSLFLFPAKLRALSEYFIREVSGRFNVAALVFPPFLLVLFIRCWDGILR